MGRLLSTPELAGRLDVSPRTLEKWRYERRGPAYKKVGGAVRYDEDDVVAWLEARAVDPGRTTATDGGPPTES